MKGRGWWPAVVLALLVGGSAFPFYWAILSSFTPESRLFQEPSLLPSHLVLVGRVLGLLSGVNRTLESRVDLLKTILPWVMGPPKRSAAPGA